MKEARPEAGGRCSGGQAFQGTGGGDGNVVAGTWTQDEVSCLDTELVVRFLTSECGVGKGEGLSVLLRVQRPRRHLPLWSVGVPG